MLRFGHPSPSLDWTTIKDLPAMLTKPMARHLGPEPELGADGVYFGA